MTGFVHDYVILGSTTVCQIVLNYLRLWYVVCQYMLS